MVRVKTLMAVAMFGALSLSPAVAADNWALQVLEDAKSAERKVARAGVRVASLGNTDVDTSSSETPRAKRSPSTASEDRPQTRRVRTASLGNSKSDAEPERPARRSLSGGSVNWVADRGCLNGTLRGVIASLASNYGPITVNSTCRSKSHNARVGGAPKSHHLDGDAVDFRIHSNTSAAYASLRGNGSLGGVKHYGGGLFHIDTGPKRSW
jgi:Peptidase M15